MSIKKAFEQLNKREVIANLVNTGNWTKNSIEVAFSRNQISKKLAFDLAQITSVPVQFWLYPDTYNMKGDRIL